MKLSKCLAFLLASFLAMPSISRCYAMMGKDKIIIGTWNVSKDSAYSYTYQALESGFKNIDTAKMYGNEKEVGTAIKQYEKEMGKKITVTAKFKVNAGESTDLYAYIKSLLDESIANLGHVDEFLLHEPCKKVKLKDIVNVFKDLSKEYTTISFGLSNITDWDIDDMLKDIADAADVIKVIQNPYWYGADNLLEPSGFHRIYDFCKNNNIKYETYKTLGHGMLVKFGLSPAFLVNHSIEKGFYPIVKASSKEHLQALTEDASSSSKMIYLDTNLAIYNAKN